MATIDLAHPVHFDPSKWIGKNNIYDIKSLPYNVVAARIAAGSIPASQVASLALPRHDLTVKDFLTARFPPLSGSLISVKATHWFSRDPPNLNADIWTCLSTRPLPSLDTLRELDKAFGQAWIDGAQSIIDPRFNEGRDHFPLWVIEWWRKLSDMVRYQAQWKQAEQWLTTESKTAESAELMSRVRDILSVLPWNVDAGFGTTTLEFVHLLGHDWLSDTLIDMMMEHLRDRAKHQNTAEMQTILIGTSLLSQ
jgi:hypothetical protein